MRHGTSSLSQACENDRATVELIIRQLKGDYALGHFPRATTWPTKPTSLVAAGIQLDELVPAALLATEFQSATLQTLRHKILLMPAQLRRTHNRPHVALPASVAGEFAWRFALNKINKLKP
jgi:hypothetical protein